MKKHTKILSLILTVIMIISAMPMTANAAKYGDLYYEINNGEVTITHGYTSTYSSEIVIPDTIEGYPVTSIGDSAFSDYDSLTSVIIPDSVTSIGDHAFYWCTSLSRIKIPKNVTYISGNAFFKCTSLKSITVDENNKHYSSDEYGVMFNKDKTILEQYPIGNTRKSYNIPNSVISLGDYAFCSCKYLTNVTIPNSVTSIGYYTFKDCISITNFTIPDSVTYIGVLAFGDCDSLTSITIPDSVTMIDSMAFFGNHSLIITINNPYCEIYDSRHTIYSAVIYGHEGSTAQAYAEKYDNNFVAIHNYLTEVTTPATHFTEGFITYRCSVCGDTYTEAIEKTTEHTYNAVVTAPSCTEQGYTTYTCDCGDTYVADYVDATGHNHTSEITTPATHLTEGVMTYTCVCGDTYTESIAKTTEHTHNAVVTAPNCTEKGFTTYTCECGDTYVADCVDATGHKDSDNDTICDSCDFVFETNNDDESNKDNNADNDNTTDNNNEKKCFCACHSDNSFVSFIYKIVRFLRTLFGLNYCRNCDCPYT